MSEFTRGQHQWVRRASLSEAVAEQMRAALRAQTWGVELPGIHALMAFFGVSAPPVKQALEILEQEGLIGPAHVGKRRAILANQRVQEHQDFLFCVQPLEEMARTTREIFWLVEPAMANAGLKWDMVLRRQGDIAGYQETLRKKLSSGTSYAGIICLDLPHAETRAIVGPRMPMLQMGGLEHDDPCASVISIRIAPLVGAALEHLFRLGITRVGVFSPMQPKTYEKTLEEVRRVHREHGLPFHAEHQFPAFQVPKLARTLRSMVAKGDLQALLIISESIWPRAMWELSRMRVFLDAYTVWNTTYFDRFENPPRVLNLRMNAFPKAVIDWSNQVRQHLVPAFHREIEYRLALRL